MRPHHSTLGLALLAAAALTACGGHDGPGRDVDPPAFGAQVNFGDSLSDVGSYAVGAIGALGGGKFTINGDARARDPALTGRIWTEVMAAQLKLPAPCPAQTGLEGDPAQDLRVPVVNHRGCFGYAQGGARVTNPVGPANARTGSEVGALTVPVVGQVANHLAAVGGKFKGDEIVFVMAGSNDVLMQLQDPGPESVAAVAAAADELAALVRKQVLGRGARHVVAINVPDIAGAPSFRAESPQVRALVQAMVSAFNERLQAGLAGDARVLYVDVHALVRDQMANPRAYGLANTETPACGPNELDGNALLCNTGNLQPVRDVGRYMFADGLHPTPFEHAHIARYVAVQMMRKGWL